MSGLERPGLERSGLKRSCLKRSGLTRSCLKRPGLKMSCLKRSGLKRSGGKRSGTLNVKAQKMYTLPLLHLYLYMDIHLSQQENGGSLTISGGKDNEGPYPSRPFLPDLLQPDLQNPGLLYYGPFVTGPFEAGPFDARLFDTGPLEAGLLEAGCFVGVGSTLVYRSAEFRKIDFPKFFSVCLLSNFCLFLSFHLYKRVTKFSFKRRKFLKQLSVGTKTLPKSGKSARF